MYSWVWQSAVESQRPQRPAAMGKYVQDRMDEELPIYTCYNTNCIWEAKEGVTEAISRIDGP